MGNQKERVAVVGASPKPDRYSNQAVRLLTEYGHDVVPIHPKEVEIEGLPVVHDLSGLTEPVDTVTLYVGAARSTPLTDRLVQLHPRRVIFNPGAENDELRAALDAEGIQTEEACTLVLLRTGQF
jgi:predicted CoA-binding protein